MDQVKTGEMIRSLRQRQGLTQAQLAGMIGVSDKAVSKWERGCGAPDISLLPCLSEALKTDIDALLRGDTEEKDMSTQNMKRMKFYVCPGCGNFILSTDSANVSCCGNRLTALRAHDIPQGGENALVIEDSDGEWYVTGSHEMTREHYISFMAMVTDDGVILKKKYPQWDFSQRFPKCPGSVLLWYCTKDGLFRQDLPRK